MTQTEKIHSLKSIIQKLYEEEGRSISYIARLCEVERQRLSKEIHAWGLVKRDVYRMTPSNQKFVNKHRQLIKSRFQNDVPESEIARELKVSRDYLRYLVNNTPELKQLRQEYVDRMHTNASKRRQDIMDKSSREYVTEDLEGEEWREILGYPGYFVSNMGRVKHYASRYDAYYLRKPYANPRNGRIYITQDGKSLMLARLVAFAFVEGHSTERNTVDHIDGDVTNNKASNLRWVSQSENNKLAYENGRPVNRAYQTNGRFKKLVVDGKYEFKTITAFAKFYGVSPTQAQRYISGECKFSHKITFVY